MLHPNSRIQLFKVILMFAHWWCLCCNNCKLQIFLRERTRTGFSALLKCTWLVPPFEMQATKDGEMTLKRLMMLAHWWWCLRGPILHSNDQPMWYLYQDSNSVLPTYIFWESALLLSFFTILWNGKDGLLFSIICKSLGMYLK